MNRRIHFFFLVLILNGLACQWNAEPPFPGVAPQRAVFGTPPPTVNPAVWFRDVKNWGAELYIYNSPHFNGSLYRQQAGINTTEINPHLMQLAFLGETFPEFSSHINPQQNTEQEKLVLEAYEACTDIDLAFYYSFPFPTFPIHDLNKVRSILPGLFKEDLTLDLSQPALVTDLQKAIRTFKTAMPKMKGIKLELFPTKASAYNFSLKDLQQLDTWLPAVLEGINKVCQELELQAWVAASNPWHTNATRRKTYEIINQFPQISILENATWPEETTLMPYLGFVPPADTLLLQQNQLAVNLLTDTEFLGRGAFPSILPRWWQHLAQQTYLRETDIAVARCFQGDFGGTATNFNRLNLHLLLRFLQEPNASLKATLQDVNEEMFGFDFPSRLTAIMIIAEDAIQAISGINHINLLDNSQFPPPSFLDRGYLFYPFTMKAIDDLFEPPGTPLYVEDAEQPDTLHIGVHWRWQQEVSARPVDQYLLDIERALDWLNKIQKEVDYLTLDFPPEQRQMFVRGYLDLLLLGRGMYQFVQGAAVHHRWYRLHKISREEAIQQLVPIAKQIRLIAVEAKGASLHLEEDLLRMADAFETLDISRLNN